MCTCEACGAVAKRTDAALVPVPSVINRSFLSKAATCFKTHRGINTLLLHEVLRNQMRHPSNLAIKETCKTGLINCTLQLF